MLTGFEYECIYFRIKSLTDTALRGLARKIDIDKIQQGIKNKENELLEYLDELIKK